MYSQGPAIYSAPTAKVSDFYNGLENFSLEFNASG